MFDEIEKIGWPSRPNPHNYQNWPIVASLVTFEGFLAALKKIRNYVFAPPILFPLRL